MILSLFRQRGCTTHSRLAGFFLSSPSTTTTATTTTTTTATATATTTTTTTTLTSQEALVLRSHHSQLPPTTALLVTNSSLYDRFHQARRDADNSNNTMVSPYGTYQPSMGGSDILDVPHMTADSARHRGSGTSRVRKKIRRRASSRGSTSGVHSSDSNSAKNMLMLMSGRDVEDLVEKVDTAPNVVLNNLCLLLVWRKRHEDCEQNGARRRRLGSSAAD